MEGTVGLGYQGVWGFMQAGLHCVIPIYWVYEKPPAKRENVEASLIGIGLRGFLLAFAAKL